MKTALLTIAGLAIFLSLSAAQGGGDDGWGEARWVWDQPRANQVPQSNEPRYLRRTFDLAGKVERAELWITVDNKYVVHVNGVKIGQDSEWSTVEKYDVAKHLVQGKNVLAIIATNQGGGAGAIARLHVRTTDKKDVFIVTDERTKITKDPAKDWLKVDFDDAAWRPAVVLGDAGIGPWNLTGKGQPVTAQGKGKKDKVKGQDRFKYGFNEVDPKVKTQLSAQEQLKHFVVPKDFEIELVAADPLIINPITMTLDDKGRIIVSESHTYRWGPPKSPIKPFANPVIRLDPDGKGGFTRTLLADGFDDPVMGIAVKGDKLWLTANNYLYTYDIDEKASRERGEPKRPEKGIAVNKKAIVTDLNKAWNPFGMFVLEWGPEGKLYMSVGNHGIKLKGPDGTLTGRGSSGIIVRMNPDGSKMERLVHGLRVPYSFDYDPFGQLWLLSNGEGNPDRFVRVIDGVDYHCFTRKEVDNNWLAGNHPLAPPCEEVHGGAHTQFMRYYAAGFPAEYQGNLFACNWGRHGFGGANRGIFRFVLDERNNVIKKETLVACTDPHFRPSHIHLDTDGSLLIADWYGRDDESDMTGRIWRLKYVGKDRPTFSTKDWNREVDPARITCADLGDAQHLVRQAATREMIGRAAKAIADLKEHAATAKEPVGAANALWVLLRIGTPEAREAIAAGAKHPDWKVRRLAVDILRRYQIPTAADVARQLGQDKEPAVRVEAALALGNSEAITAALLDALQHGAANDAHLRYEAASNLARHADEKAFTSLLTSDDANRQLAGLIAIDVAGYENFPTRKAALAALAKALENPGKLDQQLLLTVAQLDGDATIVPALDKLISRDDVPLATVAKGILVLKSIQLPKDKTAGLPKSLGAAAGKRLIEAVEKGAVKIATPADQLLLFEFLESEGPTPFSLKQIGGQLRSSQPAVRQMAHVLARKFGPASAPLAEQLWPVVLEPTSKFDEAIELLSTVARVEAQPSKDTWEKLLAHPDPLIRAESVRWWRNFKGRPEMTDLLAARAPELLKKDAGLADDLASVLTHLGRAEQVKTLKLPPAQLDKEALTKYALAALTDMTPADRNKRAALGQQVFERGACTKCHTTATQTTLLAPSLKGIAGQKLDYIVESVIYPSKIIKTGFESETIVRLSGKVLTGLVKEDGDVLRVINQDFEVRVPKNDVESRAVSRVSIMPEGQEQVLSRREFVDLIAYLATLK